MSSTAENVLTTFDDLSAHEQHEVVVEVRRASSGNGELSEQALHEFADELFFQYEAEETARDASSCPRRRRTATTDQEAGNPAAP